MNGKDIFLGLKYVGDDLIEKAEYGQFPAKEDIMTVANKRKLIRRPFLVAAIIAMLLMLVGCALVSGIVGGVGNISVPGLLLGCAAGFSYALYSE